MPRVSIFDTTTLTFNIPSPGYLNSNDDWIEGIPTPLEVTGDLQPYILKGQSQKEMFEGFKTSDAKMFICSESLPAIDDSGFSFAATTNIGGRTFFVKTRFDFSNGILTTDTNFYILVMQEIPDSP